MKNKLSKNRAHVVRSRRDASKEVVADLKNKINKSKSIIFTYYHGLTANNINDLRSKMRQAGAEMSVAKNTLLKIALKEEKQLVDEVEKGLKGPTATIFSYGDPIIPIKALVDFAKKLELPKIKFALVERRFTNEHEVAILGALPSRDVLIAQVVRVIKSPLSGLTYVLSALAKKSDS